MTGDVASGQQAGLIAPGTQGRAIHCPRQRPERWGEVGGVDEGLIKLCSVRHSN